MHWKEGHKINCKSSMPLSTNLKKNILNVRKSYFEHFSHEMLTSSLLDAKVLTGLEQKQLALEPSTSN